MVDDVVSSVNSCENDPSPNCQHDVTRTTSHRTRHGISHHSTLYYAMAHTRRVCGAHIQHLSRRLPPHSIKYDAGGSGVVLRCYGYAGGAAATVGVSPSGAPSVTASWSTAASAATPATPSSSGAPEAPSTSSAVPSAVVGGGGT